MERLSITAAALPADQPTIRAPDKQSVLHRVKAMREYRREYEERWKDIRDHQLPFIGEFGDTADATNKARRKDLMISNGVAWLANIAFAAGMESGLTPPSRQWFKFGFSNSSANEDMEAASVLDIRQEIVEYMLHRSNFYNSIHSCYMEIAHGQAPLGVFASPETGVRFQQYTIGTYYKRSKRESRYILQGIPDDSRPALRTIWRRKPAACCQRRPAERKRKI